MKTQRRLGFLLKTGFALFFTTAFLSHAEARCSRRVADALIVARYLECDSKKMLSYLYNDLVTPFSFDCAKKLSRTCRRENCAEPETPEELRRCQGLYVQVLNACVHELEGAAKMARCKDTQAWPGDLGDPTVKAVPETPPGEASRTSAPDLDSSRTASTLQQKP